MRGQDLLYTCTALPAGCPAGTCAEAYSQKLVVNPQSSSSIILHLRCILSNFGRLQQICRLGQPPPEQQHLRCILGYPNMSCSSRCVHFRWLVVTQQGA